MGADSGAAVLYAVEPKKIVNASQGLRVCVSVTTGNLFFSLLVFDKLKCHQAYFNLK